MKSSHIAWLTSSTSDHWKFKIWQCILKQEITKQSNKATCVHVELIYRSMLDQNFIEILEMIRFFHVHLLFGVSYKITACHFNKRQKGQFRYIGQMVSCTQLNAKWLTSFTFFDFFNTQNFARVLVIPSGLWISRCHGDVINPYLNYVHLWTGCQV